MFDILVWGATGFTGNLVADYLLHQITNGESKDERTRNLTWAIGGRNQSKLEGLKVRLTEKNSSAKDIGILVADIEDKNQLDEVVKQVRVVIDLAGPYSQHGTPVVDSCVRNGVHHVDLTGESNWTKKMIDNYHNKAQENGVLIVNSCGLDSLMADILTFLIVDNLKSVHNQEVKEVSIYTDELNLSISGGTAASLIGMWDLPEHVRRQMQDPYYLCDSKGIDKSDRESLKYDLNVHKWVGMNPLSENDGKIVRRSAMIRKYGQNFSWHEFIAYPGFIRAFLSTLVMLLFAFVVRFAFIRSIVKNFLPQSGQGPSMQTMKKRKFSAVAIGSSNPGSEEKEIKIQSSVKINGDPGYLETATMISECAFAIALDYERMELKGGVLTPASAFGNIIVNRLRNAGHEYKVSPMSIPSS